MMYQVCSSCGSHLDHGEVCECKAVKISEKKTEKSGDNAEKQEKDATTAAGERNAS